jgi:GT2 family glycosyltransferase/tetratricopeptide (TPR) repeat protein/glycosyltransferase involved in cell wall biosynthesis
LADRARDAGQWETAAGYYRSALERNPDRAPIWIQYGHVLKEGGKRGQAEAAYRRAVACEPTLADSHLQLGLLLQLDGREDEAKKACMRALALDPTLSALRDELTRLGWDQTNSTELRDAFDEMEKEASRKRAKTSYIARADEASDAALWGVAARLYRKALHRNPRTPPIWVQLGHALKEAGELAEAESAYRRALDYDPRSAESHLQLGHVLKLQGKSKKAQSAYLTAVAFDPGLSAPVSELRGLGWSEGSIAELQGMAGDIGTVRHNSKSDSGMAATPDLCHLQQNTASAVGRMCAADPKVSVLIPVHNRVELTRACIDSLFAYADPDISTEIIVIDDCSTDGTADYLDSIYDRIRVFRNAERGCFGHNMNKAAALARSNYFVFLNNDTEVTPFWLRRILDAALGDPTIGAVGNCQLYSNTHRINHAGMVFDERCQPVHLYEDKASNFAAARVSRDFQAVTGACLLVPRKVFFELGGFDPEFRNGFEDVDFCLRARQRGYRVRYVGDSVIYHWVGSSPGRFGNEAQNQQYFAAKWAGKIVPDRQDYLVRDATWKPASLSAPGLAKGLADLHLAVPLQFNAFSWATSQLALACDESGLTVSLLEGPIDPSIGAAEQQRLKRMMERPASTRFQIKWAHYWAPYGDRELGGKITAELFCTNYRYGRKALHQLDQWMRHTVVNTNRKLPISRYCLDALTELGVPADRCRAITLGYSPEILHDIGTDDRYRRHGFVFLALTNSHDPYRYGTDILLSAFNRAFEGREDVVLVLKDYGGQEQSVISEWVRQTPLRPKIIHLCEFVSKERLLALYGGADAFVAPFRGEGFAFKVLDAAAMGLPILAPHYGGPADYLNPDEFFSLAFKEVEVGDCLDRRETIVPAFARWAEVEVDSLAAQMQRVLAEIDVARNSAARARDRVLADFSWRRAATTLITALADFECQRGTIISARQSAKSDADVSVIIPTLDRPTELTKTLEAYDNQTLSRDKWEIVLADDGSSYDVRSHVAPFCERFRLQVISSAVQTGAGEARNRAIPCARGEFILFAGDDIVPGRDFLAAHLAAHRKYDDPRIAVLGYIDWHPHVHISRLMDYVTGDGGQQFAFKALQPHTFVPYGYFYTSNVSVSRVLLDQQEELFNRNFDGAGLEDVELGLRLARDGMQLLYVPEIVATHLHAMTDEYITRRQYKIGRWMVNYAMLHPQRISERHRQILRWLEAFQHVLAREGAFAAIDAEIAAAGEVITTWLDGAIRAAMALENVGPTLQVQPTWTARLVADAATQRQVVERMFALRLELAELDGIADEWFGVSAGDPNPARNLVRSIFGRGCFDGGLS